MSNIWPTPKDTAIDRFIDFVSLLTELDIISGETEFKVILDCNDAEFIRKRAQRDTG